MLEFLILIAFYPEGPSLALMHGVMELRRSLLVAGAGFLRRFSRLGALRVLFWEL